MSDLDTRLLKAHETRDHWSLVALYQEAADRTADEDAQYFYLTHAYIFSLELNHPDQTALRARLIAGGRETPQ